jgi:hypothetical protein
MHTSIYIYILIFSQMVFLQRDIGDMSMLIVFLLIVILSYRSFLQYNIMTSFIFFTGFLKNYI